jgi:hypothetical protein
MNVVQVVAAIVLGLSALVLILVAILASRFRALTRRIGSFECAVRQGASLQPGVAHYAVGRIEWYRVWSLSPRPVTQWKRQGFVLVSRTAIEPAGKAARPDAAVVPETAGAATEAREEKAGGKALATDPNQQYAVSVTVDGVPVEMVMSSRAYAGLASWLEAAPPGLSEPAI